MGFHVFVYGTLKAGLSNHNAYCEKALNIVPAWTFGEIAHLPAGYPGAWFEDNIKLRQGGFNLEDAIQATHGLENQLPSPAHNAIIQGELIEFPFDAEILRSLDNLEGCEPYHPLYHRWLIKVQTAKGATFAVWSYEYALKRPAMSKTILDGNWDEAEFRHEN